MEIYVNVCCLLIIIVTEPTTRTCVQILCVLFVALWTAKGLYIRAYCSGLLVCRIILRLVKIYFLSTHFKSALYVRKIYYFSHENNNNIMLTEIKPKNKITMININIDYIVICCKTFVYAKPRIKICQRRTRNYSK